MPLKLPTCKHGCTDECLACYDEEIARLRDALERAADVARNACEGWNDALMHEGAKMAGDAVQALLVPNG